MSEFPRIQTAIPQRRYHYGDYAVSVLGEIESGDDHDYQFKKKHIQQFLEAGNKVKVIMQFRGREISHLDLGLEFLQVLIQEVSEYGVPETHPQREGKLISFILSPRKTRPVVKSEESEEAYARQLKPR